MKLSMNGTKAFRVILLMLVSTVLFACGGTSAPTAPAANNAPAATAAPTTEAPAAEATEASAEPVEITITHAQGETTIAKNPQTVLVYDYSVLDTLDQLGVEVSGLPIGNNVPPFLAKYKDESKYTNIGTLFEPDYEVVHSLKADLIIVAGRSAAVYPELAKLAPTIDLSVDNKDFVAGVKKNAEILGQIFGKEAVVAERLAALDASIARVQGLAKDKNGLILMTSGGNVTAYGPGSRFGVIHDLFGVAPVTNTDEITEATHGDSISFEFILEKNPQYLFVIDRDVATGGQSEPGQSVSEVLDNELLAETDAWKNGNVVYLDPATWYLANSGINTFASMVAEVEAGLGGSSAVSSEGGEITITHAQGETTIAKNPQTVLVYDYSVLDTLNQLGVEVSGLPIGNNVPAFLSQYKDESKYTNIGTLFEPDYEVVNSLKADLIIVAGRSAAVYPELAKLAPTIDLSVNNKDFLAGVKKNAEILGQIFGKEAVVAERLAALDASIAKVQELAKDKNGLILMTSGGNVTAYGPGSRFGVIHDLFGVAPVTNTDEITEATHGDSISFEFILEKNPQYLFVIDRDVATGGQSEPGQSVAEVLDNELLAETDAWKNGNVVYLDPATWYLANSGINTFASMVAEVEAGLSK
jgi:iron complex transport system substrate-binding protein